MINWLKVYIFDSLAYIFDITIMTIIPIIQVLHHINDYSIDFLSLNEYSLLV